MEECKDKCLYCNRLPKELVAIPKNTVGQWKAIIDMYCDHNCPHVNPDADEKPVGQYPGECIGESCLIFGVRQEMEGIKRGNYGRVIEADYSDEHITEEQINRPPSFGARHG